MLIYEAKSFIDNRIQHIEKHFANEVPDYLEALKIASQCMQKQMDLVDLLNDWDIETEAKRGDKYSAMLCHDIVRQFSIYADYER